MKAHELAILLIAAPNIDVCLPVDYPQSRFCGDPVEVSPVEDWNITNDERRLILWPSGPDHYEALE